MPRSVVYWTGIEDRGWRMGIFAGLCVDNG